jgi:hypothetical protein
MMTVVTYQAKEYKVLWPSVSAAPRNSTVFSRYREPVCVAADSPVKKRQTEREISPLSKSGRQLLLCLN